MAEDSRQTPRITSSYVIRYRKPGDDRFVASPVENLSPGGFFVLTQQAYPVGQEVELQITFSNGLVLDKGKARVAHVDPGRGMGLQFSEIDEPLEEFLRDVVARRVQKGE